MKKTDIPFFNVPWEILSLLLVMILLIVIPFGVGFFALLLFRKIRPLKQDNDENLELVPSEYKDGFFKTLFIGWILCSPAIVSLYTFVKQLLNNQ